jgi:hypothetical protein
MMTRPSQPCSRSANAARVPHSPAPAMTMADAVLADAVLADAVLADAVLADAVLADAGIS